MLGGVNELQMLRDKLKIDEPAGRIFQVPATAFALFLRNGFENKEKRMAHWLMKSEPDAWSWQQQVEKGAKGELWTGVRNHTAKLNLMKMKKGDRGFFYHSNEGKEVVGICEVCALAHPDPKDDTGTWDVLGASVDPPTGGVHCEIALS